MPGRSKLSATAKGVSLAILASIFFGFSPTIGKIALNAEANPLAIQFARYLFALVVLAPLVYRNRQELSGTKKVWLPLVVMGSLMAINVYTYLSSLNYISVPLASLIFYTFPFIVAVLSHFLGIERLRTSRVLFLLLALLGIGLMVGISSSVTDWRGVLLAFSAGTGVGIVYVMTPSLRKELGSISILFCSSLVAIAVCFVYVLTLGEVNYPVTRSGFFALLAGGVSYIGGILSFLTGLKYLAPLQMAMIGNIEPVVSVLIAGLILGQFLNPMQVLGGAIVILAVFLSQRERMNHPKKLYTSS